MENRYGHQTIYHLIREKFVLPVRIWLYRYIRRILIIFILAMIANLMFSYFFYTPKMWALRQANNDIVLKYELLNDKIAASLKSIAQIRERDNEVYRSIFSADSINMPQIWTPYNASLYNHFGADRYTPLLKNSWMQIHALERQLYGESLSLDEIEMYTLDKDAMTENIPAIWPVDKKRVRGHLGAFGTRVDPINRSIRRHNGLDFPAPVGTPIYATGNGVVIANRGEWGFGKQVMIDHGFGYKTRYAHLNRIDVKIGQKIKRGEKIGEMGSTGKSTGSHLHYEVIHRGNPVNPINYFSRDMSDEDFKAIVEMAKNITYEE